jgi:endonuclease YncB( thermonuclease family)
MGTLILSLIVAARVLAPAASQTFTAEVVGVSDGDTITVYDGRQQTTIRVEGIDCPDDGADFSQRAKQFTSELVFGKEVRIVGKEMDNYGRLVATVRVGETDVSLALVEAGLAWHYKYYSSDPVLAVAETVARAKKIGIWSIPDSVPPWEIRNPELRQSHGLVSSGGATSRAGAGSLVYHGNSKSHVYHAPGCQHYDCSNCTVLLNSKEEAATQGFRPHVQCAGAAASSTASATATGSAVPTGTQPTQSGTIYHGNASSKVYHGPGCQHYSCKNCTVVLRSQEEAASRGFRPHGQCVR